MNHLFVNGFVSASIAFGMTFLFHGIAITVLPFLFDLNGVWTAMIAAEALALLVAILFFVKKKKEYHYV